MDEKYLKELCIECTKLIKRKLEPGREALLSGLESNSDFSICAGCGISADVNLEANGSKFLWNQLVYGIAKTEFSDLFLNNGTYFDDLQEKGYLSTDGERAADVFIRGYLKALSESGYLDTDNTMECVEYLKYLLYPMKKDAAEDRYAENSMALIIHSLFYERRNFNDDVPEEERKEPRKKPQEVIREMYGKKSTEGTKNTLAELAALLVRLYGSDRKTMRVLTYNYDDFLEMALRLHGSSCAFKSLYSDDISEEEGRINICHVHGFLPNDWDRRKLKGEIIFSEVSYDGMANNAYRWANRIQAETFSKGNVVFVGFSGVDVNFRRLMKQIRINRQASGNARCDNYVFMSFRTIINRLLSDKVLEEVFSGRFTYTDDTIRKDDDGTSVGKMLPARTAADILFRIIHAKEQYYREQLGINILWYEDIGEVPEMLSRMATRSKRKKD